MEKEILLSALYTLSQTEIERMAILAKNSVMSKTEIEEFATKLNISNENIQKYFK